MPHKTRKAKTRTKSAKTAVAVFCQPHLEGSVVATPLPNGVRITATFEKLPAGKHGFHIHKAGDMRQKDCSGLCEHYDKGRHSHGAGPSSNKDRHTGDLGNIQMRSNRKTLKKRYHLRNVSVQDLWGRSIIVHAGEDDLGKGSHPDSHITGHSGSRMGCAIFGRC